MNDRTSIRLVVGFLLLVACAGSSAVLSGCKPKAGDSCSPGQGVCLDGTSMLTCQNGKLVPEPCKGGKGCIADAKNSVCDNTLASVGDTCDEPGDYACQVDNKAALTCKDNKWALEETCKGAKACTLKENSLYCDNDISDPSDPCHKVGDYACASDKKLALKCSEGHQMAPINSCKGTKGCRVFEMPEEKKIEFVCDDAVADANDPCDENGEEACTMDRKGLLKCVNAKFASAGECPGGCSFDPNGEKFVCDKGALAANPKQATAHPKKGK
jgi:hypothetical protein